MIRSLIKAGVYAGVSELLVRGEKGRRAVRTMLGSIVLFGVVLFLGLLGVAALIASLFFFFAGLEEFVRPSFVTGVIVLLVAALVSLIAYRRFSQSAKS